MYLSLLRMYLSTPDAHCLGPIKLQLSEPQANLKEALQVLKLHHSKLNTTKVDCTAPMFSEVSSDCSGSDGPAGLGSRWVPESPH